MQIELTPTAGNEAFYEKLVLNISQTKLLVCIYG